MYYNINNDRICDSPEEKNLFLWCLCNMYSVLGCMYVDVSQSLRMQLFIWCYSTRPVVSGDTLVIYGGGIGYYRH